MSESLNPLLNIKEQEIVNHYAKEAENIESDPVAMLALVELILGFEPDRLPPS